MLQFNSIQFLLLLLAVTAFSNEVFETNQQTQNSLIDIIRNTEYKEQKTQKQLLDNQSQIIDDKNEINNEFLIEPQNKSLKVFPQKSLFVEHQPEIVRKELSQENHRELSQEQNVQQQKQISMTVSEDKGISQDKNIEGQHFEKKVELQPIQNDKIPAIIQQDNQGIKNNDENEITIQDIKIESIHEKIVSKIEENKSQNEDIIIIKIDQEIKATPKIVGRLENDSIKQENLEDELTLDNEQDQQEIQQCEGEELDTIHQQNEIQELNKSPINQKNKRKTTKKISENNKKLSNNVLPNNKKSQSLKRNQQQSQLIGELIKVGDDQSNLVPIIVEDSENTISIDNELQNTKSKQINIQETINENNQDKINTITTQNANIDGESFEDFQSELDELAKELDQLSLDSTLSSQEDNQKEDNNSDSLQYITISTNNDPIIIVNTLEDDYFLDDLDNELNEYTQQSNNLKQEIDSSNQQQEVQQILIVNDPEQLIIQKENEHQFQDQIQSEIQQLFNEEFSQENNISISNNNNLEIQQIQDSNDNKQLDDVKQVEQSNQFKEIDMKKNSLIKKEVSVNLDNVITNDNIINQVGLDDDDFFRIAAESEPEVIVNLEDIDIKQFDQKIQNKIQNQPNINQKVQKNNNNNNNNKEYSLKIDQNRKQNRFENDYLDQIKNTQIQDQQYQKNKVDEFNQMINDLINEFDLKNKREMDIIEYDRQITQHIIDNIEELKYTSRVFNPDMNDDDEEACDELNDYNQDQEIQEANTKFQKIVEDKEEFEKECDSNSAISEYEKDLDKRKKAVIDKIKKELMLKKERLKNSNQRSDSLSTYDFERIYLDWATNKQDIVYNILLHATNQDIQSQTSEEIQNDKVERISKKQEVEEELQKLYSNYEKDKQGRHLRGYK